MLSLALTRRRPLPPAPAAGPRPWREGPVPPLPALLCLFVLMPGPAGANGITPPNPDPDVHILLSGPTTVNNAQEALTGQTITATLSVGGTINSIKWTVTGSVFKTRSENTVPQKVSLGDKDYSPTPPSAALTFNDATAESVTVSCTGTYTDLGGDTQPANPTPQTVTFMKPTVTAWGVNTGGNGVQGGIPSGTVQAGTTKDDQGNTYSSIYANEVWGPITIAVPMLGSTSVGGQGCIAQVIQSTGDADVRSPGSTCVTIVPNGSGGYVALPTPALDTALPYPIGYTLDANGKMTVPTSSSAFTAPGTGYSGDQPKIQIFPNATDNWTSSNLSIHFGTWVMYKPKDGIWVPLQMLTWSCADTAAPSAGGPIIDPVDGKPWAAPPQMFDGGTPSDTPTYPQWIGSSAGSALGVPTPP